MKIISQLINNLYEFFHNNTLFGVFNDNIIVLKNKCFSLMEGGNFTAWASGTSKNPTANADSNLLVSNGGRFPKNLEMSNGNTLIFGNTNTPFEVFNDNVIVLKDERISLLEGNASNWISFSPSNQIENVETQDSNFVFFQEMFHVLLSPIRNVIHTETNFLFLNGSYVVVCLIFFQFYILTTYFVYKTKSYTVGQVIIKSIYELLYSALKKELKQHTSMFFPFYFTLFYYIFIFNLSGLFPISFPITACFATSFNLATIPWTLSVLAGIRQGEGVFFFFQWYYTGINAALAAFLAAIEIISNIARLVTLSIRLFANITTGHVLIETLYNEMFNFFLLNSHFFSMSLVITPLLFLPAILILTGYETCVAFLQAYIFVILSAGYMRDSMFFHDITVPKDKSHKKWVMFYSQKFKLEGHYKYIMACYRRPHTRYARSWNPKVTLVVCNQYKHNSDYNASLFIGIQNERTRELASLEPTQETDYMMVRRLTASRMNKLDGKSNITITQGMVSNTRSATTVYGCALLIIKEMQDLLLKISMENLLKQEQTGINILLVSIQKLANKKKQSQKLYSYIHYFMKKFSIGPFIYSLKYSLFINALPENLESETPNTIEFKNSIRRYLTKAYSSVKL